VPEKSRGEDYAHDSQQSAIFNVDLCIVLFLLCCVVLTEYDFSFLVCKSFYYAFHILWDFFFLVFVFFHSGGVSLVRLHGGSGFILLDDYKFYSVWASVEEFRRCAWWVGQGGLV